MLVSPCTDRANLPVALAAAQASSWHLSINMSCPAGPAGRHLTHAAYKTADIHHVHHRCRSAPRPGHPCSFTFVKALLAPCFLGGVAFCLLACSLWLVVADGGLRLDGGVIFAALSAAWSLYACSGSFRLGLFLGAGGGALMPAFEALLPKPNGSLSSWCSLARRGCLVGRCFLAAGCWKLAGGGWWGGLAACLCCLAGG